MKQTIDATSSDINNQKSEFPANSGDALLKRYEIIVNIFKLQLELIVKFLSFFTALSGAIISYFLAHDSISTMKFSLLIPAFLGVLFIFIALNAVPDQDPYEKEITLLSESLGLKGYPHFDYVRLLLYLASILFLLISLGSVMLFCRA
jgi:hypothetical protein